MSEVEASEKLNEEQSLMKQVMIDDVLYYYMPIAVAIKYADKLQSGFFVPLSETKRVRIQFGDGDINEKLNTYNDKGLDSILLAEQDYYDFLKAIKHSLISFFLKSDSSSAQSLNMSQMFHLVRKAIKFIGLEDEVIDTGDELSKKVIEKVKGISKVYSALKTFQRDNQDEFLKNMLVSYTAIALVNSLGWTTPGIKEKIIQICLFSDITLSQNDYMNIILANGDLSKLSKRVFNHPSASAKLVGATRNAFSREVVQAIEQHHEMPDGSGYPNRIKGLAINQLSAIQIISRHFIDKLVESNFAYDDRKEFINELVAKFNFPNFSAPCKALYLVMGLEPEKQEYVA